MNHAIRIHEYGGPEKMLWEEVPLPAPKPGEALVRHSAVGLNYIDVYFRTGLYKAPSMPVTIGMEGAGVVEAQVWRSDRGDGTYANPPLNADYPDPDVIRVGEDFYFITTTFANVPGLRILQSKDLVNWEIVSHVLPRLQGAKMSLEVTG